MTLSQFQQLDHETQLQVADRATCLRSRMDPEHLILLYQIEGFYIEVYYHKRLRSFTRAHAFDDMVLLDPYLEEMQINLSS
ncbi:MAG TPA: hypothetical protein VGN63_00135 [Flavisolibacter sp.]|jgi:Trm5-related predicted tRNA methylase|nr:hypothetical protein [Flavisolibacter sp.]